ncbi:DUF2155 domain-containing protein [Phaeobacter gallaeciensis]|uniref:DUF2155 domain-containing protein n=1 Tax=Phaeobacter gallaeciensis TaxID=60890 RepID=UPI00237F6441|nr:DUF2155 domain-containing protein [Phaeobacter gallaeciensis]MDE4099055.1 DUF2155 domain-containing protein [Phaeobacter gallaeciensis]MDE4107865.1 DUF2155 domain-containing protein [Phaeobacter gallaeciensis]MDE4112319.1 DUF2155 domain-containing protein [Phaeobacter gallaeciensis]MDE4116790.1 DUF2155 domain-containing protein [Phaeobacter gallaeciensis]MDE4121261.1 DUF2155 domain-containing protein [Phaeobacter gallaeciensis]
MDAAAQAVITQELSEQDQEAAQEQAASGFAAVLRGLDKVNGRTVDAEIPVGGSAEILGLIVTLGECRYPADNPTGDAYAFLTVRSPASGEVFFEGWMIASSPALNALDHNRYDVWVIRCKSE